MEQVAVARRKTFPLYGCNLVFRDVPDLTLLYGCNYGFWKHYWPEARKHAAAKWTTNAQAAEEFGINWIAERNAPGLSTDPFVIHHGHGSGYSVVSMAFRNGAERVALVGFDLRYSSDYNGQTREIGSGPRHYFGEYEKELQHWPSVQVKNGVHVELVELYRSIKAQGLLEIINCTPGSALEPIFGYTPIEAL